MFSLKAGVDLAMKADQPCQFYFVLLVLVCNINYRTYSLYA